MLTTIPFTQYLRPDGRQVDVSIERPAEICAAAEKLISAGYRFECEVLGDETTVSLTIVSPNDDEGDVAIELCPNGTEIPGAVDRLVAKGPSC